MTSHTELATTLLPPLLQDFVRLIGVQAVMALVERVGGLRIYIPTPEYATVDHQFAKIIGLDNLIKLGEVYGGLEHHQLPKAYNALVALRNARIAADYATVKTARQLAVEHRLTESQIVRIVARQGVTAPADRRQLKLL